MKYEKSLRKLDALQRAQKENVKLREENERLHEVIMHLTRELDEAEEHAFAMQEKLSQLLEKERF